jgi:hypothetical protein
MIFENYLIQAPDGVNLSRCGAKKLRWYLNNNLADIVSENPPTIRLRFEPRGRDGINDPYLLDGKPNVCVVCGLDENLTRHHIIPYCFIKHMDLEYKVDIIRDIFPLCRPCHNQYEKFSHDKRIELLQRFGICLDEEKNLRSKFRNASGAAKTILKQAEKIPPERKEKLIQVISEFLNKSEISKEDLQHLTNPACDPNPNISELVAKQITDYNEFAKEWRTHFVNTMAPKFMPDNWRIDRKTEHVWIPRHLLSQNTKCKKN